MLNILLYSKQNELPAAAAAVVVVFDT